MTPKMLISVFVLIGLGFGVYIVSTLQAPSAAALISRTRSSPDNMSMDRSAQIGPEQLQAYISDGSELIDVRSREEYASGHIEGARNIDLASPSFADEVTRTLATDKSYVLYCRSGRRSALAVQRMRDLGFANVVDLTGGVLSWEAAGHTLCTDC